MRINNNTPTYFLRIHRDNKEFLSPLKSPSSTVRKDILSLSQEKGYSSNTTHTRVEKTNVVIEQEQIKSVLLRMRELAVRAANETMPADSEERSALQVEIVKLFAEFEKLSSKKDKATIDSQTKARIDAIHRYYDYWRYPPGESPAMKELVGKVSKDFISNDAHFQLNAELKQRYNKSLAALKEKYMLRKPERSEDGYIELEGGALPFWSVKEYNLHNIMDEEDRSRFDFVQIMQSVKIDEWEYLGEGKYFSQVALDWAVNSAVKEVQHDDVSVLKYMPSSLITPFHASQTVSRIDQLLDCFVNNKAQNLFSIYREWEEQAIGNIEEMQMPYSKFSPNAHYDIPTTFNSLMAGYAKTGNIGFLGWV